MQVSDFQGRVYGPGGTNPAGGRYVVVTAETPRDLQFMTALVRFDAARAWQNERNTSIVARLDGTYRVAETLTSDLAGVPLGVGPNPALRRIQAYLAGETPDLIP